MSSFGEMPRLLVGWRPDSGVGFQEGDPPRVHAPGRAYFYPPEGGEVRYPSAFMVNAHAYDLCLTCERFFAVTVGGRRVRTLACTLRCSLRQRGHEVHEDGAPKRKYTKRAIPGVRTSPSDA